MIGKRICLLCHKEVGMNQPHRCPVLERKVERMSMWCFLVVLFCCIGVLLATLGFLWP